MLVCAVRVNAEGNSEAARLANGYAALRDAAKKDRDARVNEMIGGMKKLGNAITPEKLKILTEAANDYSYQHVIDGFVCLETIPDNSTSAQIESCINDRTVRSTEMFRYIMDYGASGVDTVLSTCMMKNRLLDFEIRYPPYDFYRENVSRPPQAFSAKAFVECFKSRL